jgi:hypothetical protein
MCSLTWGCGSSGRAEGSDFNPQCHQNMQIDKPFHRMVVMTVVFLFLHMVENEKSPGKKYWGKNNDFVCF